MGLFLAIVCSITRTRGIGVTCFDEFSFLVASFFLLFLTSFFLFLASFFLLFLFVLKSRRFGILNSNTIHVHVPKDR